MLSSVPLGNNKAPPPSRLVEGFHMPEFLVLYPADAGPPIREDIQLEGMISGLGGLGQNHKFIALLVM